MELIFSSGNIVSLPYVIYKCIVGLIFLINGILSMVQYPYVSGGGTREFAKYFIYATHWGVMLITLSMSLDAILVLIRYISQNQTKNGIPHYEENHFTLQGSMFLTAVSYPWVLSVTLIYWPALYDWSQEFVWNWDNYLDVYIHLVTTLLALLDTFVSSRPWNLWHSWYVISI